MALYISLKRRRNEEDFSRFKSGLVLFSEMFNSFNVSNKKILLYKDYPILGLNKDLDRMDYEFGLLESSYRGKLKNNIESSHFGFEIWADLVIDKKVFKLLFELFPRNKSLYHDIRVGLLPNGYAEDIEDIEEFYPKLRYYIFDRILHYNKEIEHKRKQNLFLIRRALISEHKKEFHNIDEWSFFYSKEPEEFITNLTYGAEAKEMRERLIYANKEKFAEFLKNLNQVVIKMFDYAKESQVIIKEGSIAVIPKDKEAMKEFVGKMRERVSSVAKIYPIEEDIKKEAEKVFSN